MKKKDVICAVLAAVVFIAFFLPWVSVGSEMVGTVAKVLTGKHQAEIAAISGFAVPGMANGPDARLMISVIQIFNPGVTNADKKSWLIWGVPLFAIAIFVLGLYWGENKWFNLAVAVIGVLIFLAGVYKITTTDLNKLVLNAKIGIGVWLTLCGYLGLGVVAAVGFAKTLVPALKKKE
jgi:hypothetical protein